MNNDPWKHRSDNMKCKTCMWFVLKASPEPIVFFPGPDKPAEVIKTAYNLGRCRRHAPTMNGYPVVFVNDWCGDHKLDETKL